MSIRSTAVMPPAASPVRPHGPVLVAPSARPACATSHPAPDPARRWTARLFGSFRLLAPDGVDMTPAGRKARALVAYLLTTTDTGATRERLAGLLWSERGEDQARASLRQTLHTMRALTRIDAAPIALDRRSVRIVPARVVTDLAPGDEPDAGTRVPEPSPGDDPLPAFLADLDGIDPAFDDWLSVERVRRADRRRDAVLAAAERALARGDFEAARRRADRLLACDATDEAAARLAMRAHHAGGDRDTVRRVFAQLQDALQRQIGVGSSPQTVELQRALLDPVPREAPRDVPRIPDTEPRAVASGATLTRIAPTPPSGAREPAPRGDRRSSLRAWVAATCACAGLAIGIGVVSGQPVLSPALAGTSCRSTREAAARVPTAAPSAGLARSDRGALRTRVD